MYVMYFTQTHTKKEMHHCACITCSLLCICACTYKCSELARRMSSSSASRASTAGICLPTSVRFSLLQPVPVHMNVVSCIGCACCQRVTYLHFRLPFDASDREREGTSFYLLSGFRTCTSVSMAVPVPVCEPMSLHLCNRVYCFRCVPYPDHTAAVAVLCIALIAVR
jgi:hypothetical protein